VIERAVLLGQKHDVIDSGLKRKTKTGDCGFRGCI